MTFEIKEGNFYITRCGVVVRITEALKDGTFLADVGHPGVHQTPGFYDINGMYIFGLDSPCSLDIVDEYRETRVIKNG